MHACAGTATAIDGRSGMYFECQLLCRSGCGRGRGSRCNGRGVLMHCKKHGKITFNIDSWLE